MRLRTHTTSRWYRHELENFHTRLIARLCVILLCLTQIGQRLFFVLDEPGMSRDSQIFYLTSLPFLVFVSIIVGIEFILFKKIGTRIIKYSRIIDLIFFFTFIGEWFFTLYAAVIKATLHSGLSYGISAIFGFTSFSWRTQLQSFVTHRWYLKCIPTTMAYILVMVYAIKFDPQETIYTLIRGILQMLYVILYFYFEDKIKLKMLLTNMHHEKWMQINEFILNNIPENIAIIDVSGEAKFISENFKNFIHKCCGNNNALSVKEFCEKIQNLEQYDFEAAASSPNGANRSSFSKHFISISPEGSPINRSFQSMKSLSDLISNFQAMIKTGYLQERAFLVYNGKLKLDNSKEKHLEVKISFIQQHNQEYITLILRDTTQRDLLVTLQDNNKYKDHLLASVSHELRAPLNGNINLVETAVHSRDVPETIKESLLTPALRSSKFLLHIINDILDMSQIKAQKLRMVFQSAKLKETLLNTVQLIELQAKKKEISLQVNIHPKVSGRFCTDHMRLSQIVLNLLNNAIKFTKNGFVELVAAPVEGVPSWVKISVRDSGIGMTSEDISKLFQTFTRIEINERKTINPTGVGLGLNIAHNLAGFLGPKEQSEIEVKSTLNQGSIFSFVVEDKDHGLHRADSEHRDFLEELSIVPNEVEIMAETALIKMMSCLSVKSPRKESIMSPKMSPVMSPTLSPKRRLFACECPRVLIVDDNPFNIMALETILGSLRVKFESVYNGRSCLDKILNRIRYPCSGMCKNFELIFMDQEMPEMTGSETVREIKEIEKQNDVPHIKIIGCTAHGGREEVENFIASGINQCITKPISMSAIKKLLEQYRL